MEVKRSKGVTVLSLFLAWFSIASFGNVYVMTMNYSYGSLLLIIGSATYGCLALASCVGLWKMKSWAYPIFLLWCVVVVAFALIFQYSVAGVPYWQFILFLLFMSATLGALARYIRKTLKFAL